MGGAKGRTGAPVPSPCSLAVPMKNFDGDIVPSGHFIILKCELLNIILCKRTQIFVSFFAFLNIKKQANLRLSLHVQKLKVFQLQGGFAFLTS